MAIKVGNNYVSEAAYTYAQKAASSSQSNKDMLSRLSDKFPNARFSANTQPFQTDGKNNIAVSPAILKQMENSPEKRLEYEALIYDCNAIQQSFGDTLPNGSKIASQGFIIDAQGNLSSWCVTKPEANTNKKSLLSLPKDDKASWLRKITASVEQTSFLLKNETGWRI